MNNLELIRSLEANRKAIADHRKALANARKLANKLTVRAIELHASAIRLEETINALDASEPNASAPVNSDSDAVFQE